jgi:hypothetical protein
MAIVAIMNSAAAQELRGNDVEGELAEQVRAVVSKYQGDLRPMHPSLTGGDLSRYFVVETDSSTNESTLAAALRSTPGVEGAYSKPDVQPPRKNG